MAESSVATRRLVRLLAYVERAVVIALILLLVLVIAISVVELWTLVVTKVATRVREINDAAAFQEALQNAFGGVLIVLLGLELLETMKVYFEEHHVRVEVILLVAIIATGRHIIQIDVHHTGPLTLFGLAALMLTLSASYFLIKRET